MDVFVSRVLYYCRIILLLGFSCGVYAQPAPLTLTPVPRFVTGVQNPVQPLNGVWRFKINHDSIENTILVPGEWEMQGFTVGEADTAVYTRELFLPADWKGKKIIIRFDAVSSHARVKLNGTTVKEHEGGFTPFEADITAVVKEGRNELRVEVQARTISDVLAATSQYAGHTVGGILRKLTLFALPQNHISDLFVAPDFDDQYRNARLKFATTINYDRSPANNIVIHHTLKDTAGKIVADQLIPAAKINTEYSLDVAAPEHWNPEHPYLYTLITELLVNNQPVQTLQQKIGFREIQLQGNRVLLNGQPLKLHGVNRHETHPYEGRSVSAEWSRKDAELFRNGNCNFVRTSHYPPSEEFLDAADELGLLVESEAALCWINHPASPIWQKWYYKNPAFLPWLLQANEENILNGRNHPSVIIWSLANESTWSPLWENVLSRVKAIDPSRVTTFHDQSWGTFNNAGSKADIANYHYPDVKGPAKADSIKLRPVLFGEYAHIATYNRREVITDPGIRSAYGQALIQFYDSLYYHIGCLGGAIWGGIDDLFHLSNRQIAGYGPWGVIDSWRRIKPEYSGMKKAYSPVVIKSIDTLSRKNEVVTIEVENRYDFTNLDKITINCKLDGKDMPVRSIAVAPHARGKLDIPVAAGSRELYLSFTDPRGFTSNEERIILHSKAAQIDSLVKLGVTETPGAYLVKQGDIEYTISKQNGLLTAAKRKGKLILDRGPVFGIVPASSDDGGKPGIAGETFQTDINPLQDYPLTVLYASTIDVQQKDRSITITAALVYKEGKGQQSYSFTTDGKVTTHYEVNYTGNNILPRQYGLFLQLPRAYSKLSWERKPERNYTVADIGRAEGEALLNARNTNASTDFRKAQGIEWKDDANELGSNDFRSTKRNIFRAQLQDVSGTGIRVTSGGTQATRTWLQDQYIQLLVADFNSNGSEPYYQSPFKSNTSPVKKGQVLRGSATFSLFQLSDSALQSAMPPTFTIGAGKDNQFPFRGNMASLRLYKRVLQPDAIQQAAKQQPGNVSPSVEWLFSNRQDTVYLSTDKQYKASSLNYSLQPASTADSIQGIDFTNGHLAVQTDTNLVLGKNFSVECWVNVKTPNSGMYILDFINPAKKERFSLELKDELLVATNGKRQSDEYWAYEPGSWMHIVVVCKDTLSPEIYINGERGPKYRNAEKIQQLSAATSPADSLTLWYTRPATQWKEGMVIGNGQMGGVVMGGITDELVYLNNDELWSGYPRQLQNPRALKSMKIVRQLLREGKTAEAEVYADNNLHMPYSEGYLPMGMLHLQFPFADTIHSYRRELDISKAVTATTFTHEGINYTRQVFASHPDKAIIIRLEADKKGALSFTASLNSLLQHTVMSDKKVLRLSGRAPIHTDPHYFFTNNVVNDESENGEGTAFEIQLKAVAEGGSVTITGDKLQATNCNKVTLVLVSATSFNGYDKSPSKEGKDPVALCEKYMEGAIRTNYKTLLQNHINDYQRLFNRVSFTLNQSNNQLPTNERIKKYQPGKDNGLAALYMQFGRYLLIAASRSGSQPINLQGIWNKNMNAPWASNYTLNCNAEIAYWPVEIANLTECHLPLITMVKELVTDGRRTARLVYGTNGWVVHHTTDIWRTTTPVDESVSWALFPGAGAWLCQHLWEHYAFTKDENYLKEVWPVLKEAAVFYKENLQLDTATGSLIISPDVNFENRFRFPDGSTASLGGGVTATMQMVRQLFTNCINTSVILKTDSAFREELKWILPKLPPMKVDERTGELQEWYEPRRHAYPDQLELLSSWGAICSNQISVDSTPALANALRTAFDNRALWRQNNVGSWQGAFQANVYTRLHDGDTALAVLNKHLQTIVNPNLTAGFIQSDWEIDGNMGMTAAICELLMQSQNNVIELLPALPKVWSSGSVKGLKARGNFTVDIDWENGKVTHYRISASQAVPVKIKVNGEVKEILSSEHR